LKALAVLFITTMTTMTCIGKEPKEWEFIYGADISALPTIEAKGSIFREKGAPADAIHLLTKHGVNAYRVRLFVNPTMEGVVVQDLPYTLKLAKRIKAAGGKFLLDLHYSDTWADPAHQHKPKAWESLSFKELEAAVEDYSSDVIKAFKKAGCLPDMVQVGNEIHPGFLWPTGKIGDEQGGWERFTTLLKAGIRGVRAPLAKDDDVKIMIHSAKGGKREVSSSFFGGLERHGVDFDIIGFSYYPSWEGGIDALKENLKWTGDRFKKPMVVVEVAYPWEAYEKSEMKDNLNWPQTPDGQSEFLRDVTDAVKATPGNLGIGVFWWYPEAIPTKGLGIWNGGRTALFDKNGEVLPALREWRTQKRPNEHTFGDNDYIIFNDSQR